MFLEKSSSKIYMMGKTYRWMYSVDIDRNLTGGSSPIVDGVSDDSVEYELAIEEMDAVYETDSSETDIELDSVEKSSVVGFEYPLLMKGGRGTSVKGSEAQ